jgi:carbonic anhydrase
LKRHLLPQARGRSWSLGIGPFTDVILETTPYSDLMRAGRRMFFGIFAALPVGAAVAGTESHWSYAGQTGPSHWSSVEPGYGLCGTGKFQSPINIMRAQTRAGSLPPLSFSYSPGIAKVVDNGHTVEVQVAPGNILTVGSTRYSLVQFHFHRPSEEQIDGKRFEMSAHFVHSDAAGHLAVVAVLIEQGGANPLFERISVGVSGNRLNQPSAIGPVNALELLPARHAYYSYRGSLTTPPCTQGVRWFVLKNPVTLSAAQIASFAGLYPNNSRPVQPLNGRVVLATQ